MSYPLREWLRFAFGGRWIGCEPLMLLYSMRLDETGTDGLSTHVVVGGAVATLDQWDKLEERWEQVLATAGVEAFHTKEFESREGDFAGWSDFKASRFATRLRKVCDRNTAFKVAVATDPKAHKSVKARMRGISGYRADSDYGLCLRWLIPYVCQAIRQNTGDNFELSVILEDGPYSAAAVQLFHRIRSMTKGKVPPPFAHKLGAIGVLPKGRLKSLEAADFLVGEAATRFGNPAERGMST